MTTTSIAVDFMTKTITVSRTFLKASRKIGSPEFLLLKQLTEEMPSFSINLRAKAIYAEDPVLDANGCVIVKNKSQMEAEKKAKAQEEAKRAEKIAAAETQEETEVQKQEIEEVAA